MVLGAGIFNDSSSLLARGNELLGRGLNAFLIGFFIH